MGALHLRPAHRRPDLQLSHRRDGVEGDHPCITWTSAALQDDTISATVEFWNRRRRRSMDLNLTAWCSPNDGPVLELTRRWPARSISHRA